MKNGQKIIGYRVSERSDTYRIFTLEMREMVVCDAARDVARNPSDYHVERLRGIKDETGETQYFDDGIGRVTADMYWQGNVGETSYYAGRVECPLEAFELVARIMRGLPKSDRINGVSPAAMIEHIESKGALPVRYLDKVFGAWVYDETAVVTS